MLKKFYEERKAEHKKKNPTIHRVKLALRCNAAPLDTNLKLFIGFLFFLTFLTFASMSEPIFLTTYAKPQCGANEAREARDTHSGVWLIYYRKNPLSPLMKLKLFALAGLVVSKCAGWAAVQFLPLENPKFLVKTE